MRIHLFTHRTRVLVPSLVSASVFGFFVACAPNGGKVPVRLSAGGVAANAAKAAVAKVYSNYNQDDADNVNLSSRVLGVSASVAPTDSTTPTLGLTDVAPSSVDASKTVATDVVTKDAVDTPAVGADSAPTATATPAGKQFFKASVQMLVKDQVADSQDNNAFVLSASGTIYSGEENDVNPKLVADVGITSTDTNSAATPQPTATPVATATPSATATPAPAAAKKVTALVLQFDGTTSVGAASRFKIQSYCGNADCSLLLVRLVEKQVDGTGASHLRQFVVTFQANPVDPKNPGVRDYAILWNGTSTQRAKTASRGTPSTASSSDKIRKTTFKAAVADRQKNQLPIAAAAGDTAAPTPTPVATPAAPAGTGPAASQATGSATIPVAPAAQPQATQQPAATVPATQPSSETQTMLDAATPAE